MAKHVHVKVQTPAEEEKHAAAAKITRLRALRLAKEAADRDAANRRLSRRFRETDATPSKGTTPLMRSGSNQRPPRRYNGNRPSEQQRRPPQRNQAFDSNGPNDIGHIRHMSATELRYLGMPHIAYIKRVSVNDEIGYAVHAADGTPIAVLPDRALAFATTRLHDIEPVSVH